MGNSVLLVPVPELDPFVRDRTAHHDADQLADDPLFTHAHVTVLRPFLDEVGEEDRAKVAAIARDTEPFEFRLERFEVFPHAMIVLVPEPDGPFRELTRRLRVAFPQCPPDNDELIDVRPHLTLDRCSELVSEQSTREALGDVLPAQVRAGRLDLAWYEPRACRVLDSWVFGG